MVVDMSREFKRYSKICETLRQVLSDTQSALDDICNNLQLGKEIKVEFIGEDITRLEYAIECTPVVLVYGQSCLCKAILINSVLEQPVLPVFSSQWRWVKFIYGHNKNVRLTLGREYEFVDRIKALDNNWVTVPVEDLQRVDGESPLDHCPTVEITLCNSVLRDNLQICVPPDCGIQNIPVVAKSLDNVLPVIIYAIDEDVLSDSSIQEIRKIKETYEDLPVLFVSISSGFKLSNEALTESERHLQECKEGNKNIKRLHTLRRQLVRLGYLNENTEVSNNKKQQHCNECTTNNLISDENIHEDFLHFTQHSLQRYLLNMAQTLSEKHNKCLRRFVLSAFDMAREIQITPRRISYAQEIELKLYNTLMKIASQKQEEISTIIQNTLQDMKSNIAEILEEYHSKGENSNFHQQSAKMVTLEIQQIVLRKLSNSVATKLVESVGCLKESFTGTLQRCLESLERNCQEFEGSLRASDAVKQIVTAAYNIDLNCSSSFSVVHTFMDRLRQLLHNLQLPWSNSTQPQCNKQWQLQIVADMVDSLSYSKLAKTISTQFQEHIKSSHDAFQSAMRSLDNQLSGQLEQTEEQRIAIRKRHAPRFARLALESTSLCDLIRWGMPKQIREIGRGQYGVVYSCEPWAGVNPCAYKSVVPPDDRHWNDLAMEFYYTRTIPNHARIVKLRGSIVDHSYGGGSSAAVLLVMERMTRDLYCGIKSGLPWAKRIQIAIDVVEGIRYLHSQGLIHRDIKLKNVLLDNDDRAKLTDFGFCIPEAMMSGSIVGTPIHMAPELLSGRYDSSVDVYAFGILFWYICAGKVRLPNHFEQFHSKEQLWTSVRRGVRPECLPGFDQACWNLMEQCWSAEPSERPLLGYVQPQLQKIQQNSIANSSPGKSSSSSYGQAYETDCFYNNYDYVQLREY